MAMGKMMQYVSIFKELRYIFTLERTSILVVYEIE